MLDSGMPDASPDTRTRIMDEAERLILDRGYAGTPVDAVVERAGVTKGAFFHHFSTKDALAQALVERWAERDRGHLETSLERAGGLTRDPVQRLLVFVGLLEESWRGLTEPYAGCLFASYVSESGLFGEQTHAVIRRAMLRWRDELRVLVEEAVAAGTPRAEVDPEAMADLLTVVFEGAFILSRTLGEADLVARQLHQYRTYLELLFDA